MRKELMRLDQTFPVDAARRTIANNRITQHWHPFLEIGYCLDGEGLFHISDKTYSVRAGDVFVIRQAQPHIANAEPGKSCRFLFVYFKASVLEASEPELLLPFHAKPSILNNRIDGALPVAGEIGRLLVGLGDELEEKQIGYRSQVRGALLQACALLARHYRAQMKPGDWNALQNSFHRLYPALEYIREHLADDIRLQDVADHISLSPSRTYHLFKEIIGDGFKEHLIKMRIKEAQRLLVGTDLPITDVFLQSGFPNHASFYRSFQQIVNMTPGEYRNVGGGVGADELRRSI